ncbi:dihydrofolate reductase family protein [Kibdelosporangium persicum]|uniref:Dihydrofolate reductase n=1 Tax=Kibdelosporangium persicum TaxID=2698649 RepID=A0ABX2F7N4_9PSEU|nr:dihydrofolate reductase family protein [Kibdelosporangium persicum]NRN66902.1 Dihydrofolate reductase [Kibdelosporangium persicum]
MRKLVYYAAVSLDGYIAGPGGEYDFYPGNDAYTAWMAERFPDTIPTQFRDQIGLGDVPNKNFDAVLMGLSTYLAGPANPFAHLEQYVVSTTLEKSHHPAVTVVRDPVPLVKELKQRDGLDIWVCGGGKLAGCLLPEIDRLVIKSYPVIAGAGVSLVSGNFQPTQFTPVEHISFDTGTYVTWFDRK